MPFDQKSFFYMGLTDGGGRRLSFFPNDFEYLSEDEKIEEDYKRENGDMITHLQNFEGQPPLVLSRRESGNDHSTATSHCSQSSVAMKKSRKSYGIKKSRKESSVSYT